MSDRTNAELIGDIQEAIRRVEAYTKAMNYEQFLRDAKVQDAVVRNLEIIGEAVKNLSPDFKKNHKDLDWKSIAGFRDRVIHHYFGVNWDIVWDVVRHKVPELKAQLLQR
jgi:uncharacterized protein with HEPN domain